MNTIYVLGIILSVVVLSIMCIKNVNVYIIGVVCALIVAVTNQMPLYGSLKDVYFAGFGNFISGYFLMFFVGAIFGKIMEVTGLAKAIAKLLVRIAGKNALYAIPLLVGLLVYGGVNGYVGVFTAMPIIVQVFRERDIPNRFIPIAFMFSADTWSNSGIGSPNMLNYMSTNTMGVSLSAAPMIGIVGMIINFVGGELVLWWFVSHAKRKGEHYIEKYDDVKNDDETLPNGLLALLPLLTVFISINITVGGTSVIPVEVGLFLGCIVALIIGHKNLVRSEVKGHLETAVKNTLGMAGTLAVLTGYGSMITNSPAFGTIRDAVVNLPIHPLFGLVIATCVMAAVTCSGTAAAGIVLPILGPIYTGMGLAPELVARVFALSACSFDMMPQNAFCYMMINEVAHETYKDAYMPVFWSCVLIPLLAAIVGATLGIVLY